MSKTIRLGTRLRYPITIVKLLKSPGDQIKKQEPVMEYSFKWMKEVGDSIRGETWEEEQTTIVPWESPADGEFQRWHIREGQRIEADGPCMAVQEACPHSIQFQGLCGLCGKDMTEVNWAAETRETERAPINMVHDQTNLMVSATLAQQTEHELQKRLLQSRKLSLVVDLDQTVIQACIDPTVGEWQRDPTNPNHESVKEVKTFQLDDGPSGLTRRCSYYIKMRPGLERFLKRISEMYELHVYTMGTRAYAQNVANVVDPEKKLFGNRVISRDENGNIYTKSLQRLFPVSTHMVVIIDDRSDVWPRNRPNLIKVSPYEFFKGIGDINSSFLPKRQDLLSSTTNGKAGRKKGAPLKNDKDDAAARAAIASGDEDSALTQRQLQDQERTFEKQIKDRPLQLLQEKLDREDEEAEKATTQSEDGSESRSSSPAPHRHRVLQDDDNELTYLERHLTFLHQTYFTEYDRNRAQHSATTNVDLSSVPDVGRILDELKSNVLQGFKIVLSGVLPRGIDIYKSEIGLQIMSFGAELRPKIRGDVTHLVVNAAQPGSEKLLEARRRPHIKIVSQEWLADCFSRWTAVDETPYLFSARLLDEDPNKAGDAGMVSDEDDADIATNGTRPKHPRLRLISASGQTKDVQGEDDESENDFDADDEGLIPDDIEDGQLSPIDGLKTFNWGSADAELNEFLASGSSDEDDDDDDEDEEDEDNKDTDSVKKQNEEEINSSSDEVPKRSKPNSRSGSPANRKRKSRDEEEDTGTESDRAAAKDDEPQQQQQQQHAKKLRRITKSPRPASSLRNQYVSGDEEAGSGLPTPRVTGDEGEDEDEMKGVQGSQQQQQQNGDGNEEEEEIEFDEAELEAMFEAEFSAATAEAGLDDLQGKG